MIVSRQNCGGDGMYNTHQMITATIFFLFWERVHAIAQADFEFVAVLFPFWDYRNDLSQLLLDILRMIFFFKKLYIVEIWPFLSYWFLFYNILLERVE